MYGRADGESVGNASPQTCTYVCVGHTQKYTCGESTLFPAVGASGISCLKYMCACNRRTIHTCNSNTCAPTEQRRMIINSNVQVLLHATHSDGHQNSKINMKYMNPTLIQIYPEATPYRSPFQEYLYPGSSILKTHSIWLQNTFPAFERKPHPWSRGQLGTWAPFHPTAWPRS